jgi:hypothetical protein
MQGTRRQSEGGERSNTAILKEVNLFCESIRLIRVQKEWPSRGEQLRRVGHRFQSSHPFFWLLIVQQLFVVAEEF